MSKGSQRTIMYRTTINVVSTFTLILVLLTLWVLHTFAPVSVADSCSGLNQQSEHTCLQDVAQKTSETFLAGDNHTLHSDDHLHEVPHVNQGSNYQPPAHPGLSSFPHRTLRLKDLIYKIERPPRHFIV